MTEIAKTADQALRILTEVISHGPLTAQDLARRLGLNRTACHRLLATLHARGFVRKDGSNYSVGHVFLQLAHDAPPAMLVNARPVLRQLAEHHGETFLLTVVDGDDAVAIDQAVGDGHALRVAYQLGGRHPLALGASGRTLLAYLGPERIARATEHAPDPAQLLSQLEQVRRDGFCTSHDELHPNVVGVSVPILEQQVPLASLTALAPSDRAEQLRALVPELRRAATAISQAARRPRTG